MAKEQWETYFDAVKRQDWKTAKDTLTAISREDRNNSQTFLKLGDICQRTGNKSEAIAAYTHAAQLLRLQGFAQKALATYKIALRLDPQNPEIIKRAEILIEEFEASRTASHTPVFTPSKESGISVSEVAVQAEPEAAAQQVSSDTGPSEWLEKTSYSEEVPADTIETPKDDEGTMPVMEPTSLTPGPESGLMTESGTESKPEPETPSDQEISDSVVISQDPLTESATQEAKTGTEEEGDWLESAYDALDTRIFKPESERTPDLTAQKGDAINLVYRQTTEEKEIQEDLSAEVETFLKPLSERNAMRIPEMFADLSEEMVMNFISELSVLKFRDKQHVVEESDAGDSMYIVRSGKAKVVAHLLGRELELAVLGDGDVFGEVGFLTGRPRTASVIADGPLEVYEISRMDIEKLIETNPEVMAKIEDFYEMRVRDTIRKIKS